MTGVSTVALLAAFAAGIVSFLSPCVLPLVPGYVSYVSGCSLGQERCTEIRSPVVQHCLRPRILHGLRCSWRKCNGHRPPVPCLQERSQSWRRRDRHHLWPGDDRLPSMALASPGHSIPPGVAWRPDLLRVRPWTRIRMGMDALHRSGTRGNPDYERGVPTVAQGVILLTAYSLGLGIPFLASALFTDRLVGRLKRLGAARPHAPDRRWRHNGRYGRRHGHRPTFRLFLLAARNLPSLPEDRMRMDSDVHQSDQGELI
jgi:cytochrome c-type biogenesis protein